MNTAVLFLVFNRPDTTFRVFDVIRRVQPPRLYVAADGPRSFKPGEQDVCEQVRLIATDVDWPCEVKTLFRHKNIGCKMAISSAITWFFEQEPEGIILEDDCVPDISFFRFCEELLEKYRDEPRVMTIGGNLVGVEFDKRPEIRTSYFFSKYVEVWGWASWRRAWKLYDRDMSEWPRLRDSDWLFKIGGSRDFELYWQKFFQPAYSSEVDTWDIQWVFSIWFQQGLSILPSKNLVTNIGFNQDATHTTSGDGVLDKLPLQSLDFPINHPETIERNQKVDNWLELGVYKTTPPSNKTLKHGILRMDVVKNQLRKIAARVTGIQRFETISARELIKLLIPPLVFHAYRALREKKNGANGIDTDQKNGPIFLTGDYSSWSAAQAESSGYDAEIILEKTRDALLKVKNGEAVYERDSVLFDEIQYTWPILSGLLWVAARSGGGLNVLDFGGSLGSTYFQNRAFLTGLREVRWNIVEQKRQVEVGQQWFADDTLKFYPDISTCLSETHPQVVLLSGVLQYLPEPYTLLEQLLVLPCEYLLIDRTPFWAGPTDRLCIQHVPAGIYPASYPSWIFSSERFHSYISAQWQIITKFDGFDALPAPIAATWGGIIATKKRRSG